jgi:hypothetical protein
MMTRLRIPAHVAAIDYPIGKASGPLREEPCVLRLRTEDRPVTGNGTDRRYPEKSAIMSEREGTLNHVRRSQAIHYFEGHSQERHRE